MPVSRMGKTPKAIALMSGGLDSTLAARIVKDENVEVVGLHLTSPFACHTEVQKNAEAVGIPLLLRDKGEAYLDLVKSPKYGYGRAVNPCIDCRIFMFQLAEAVREEQGADFIVTGEVLGQRPMSQRRDAMNVIDRDSHMQRRILRPLSAQLLPPTIAEEAGWVRREKMLAVSGRGRHVQLELARKLGITDFPNPSGGCLLTEIEFAAKLRDFFQNDDSGDRLVRARLLRHGRHFRVGEKTRVIVGRDHGENVALREGWKAAAATFFTPVDFLGPDAVAFGPVGPGERDIVGRLIARYGKGVGPRRVALEEPGGERREFPVEGAIEEERIERLRI